MHNTRMAATPRGRHTGTPHRHTGTPQWPVTCSSSRQHHHYNIITTTSSRQNHHDNIITTTSSQHHHYNCSDSLFITTPWSDGLNCLIALIKEVGTHDSVRNGAHTVFLQLKEIFLDLVRNGTLFKADYKKSIICKGKKATSIKNKRM